MDVNNDSDNFGGAVGAGLGVVFSAFTNPVMVELEYSIIDKNIEMFAIGMTTPF